MKEIWKDIKGFDGKYQISNFGNVKSNGYKVYSISYGTPTERYIKPRILKQAKIKDYYRMVTMGVGNRKYVHRLVAETFIPNPNNYPQVLHINNNPSNNRVDNLMWGTQKMNMQQCVKDGRHKGYETGHGLKRYQIR